MHSFLEISNISGETQGQITPIDPSFSFILNGVDTLSWDMPRDHKLATIDYIEPYAADFAWFINNEELDGPQCLIGGMITAVSMEPEQNFQLSGKSWEHYLEKRRYPFNPNNPTSFFYAVVNEDVFTIVETILDTTLGRTYSLDLNYDNGLSGILRNFRIEPGDTENVLEKINQLSEQVPSFDYAIDPLTKEFKMYVPEKGVTKTDYMLAEGNNVLRIHGNDEGIEGNSVLVSGAGSSRKLAKQKNNLPSMAKYRRLDSDMDFGDVIDPNYLDSLADAELTKDVSRDYGITVDIIPGKAQEVLANLDIGDTVKVRGDLNYTKIDDFYRITQIDGSMNRQKDLDLTLTFNLPTVLAADDGTV